MLQALDAKPARRGERSDRGPGWQGPAPRPASRRHRAGAWARENGLVLGQLKVRAKSNEIPAVPELWRALERAGGIVTLAAVGCPKNIAQEIKEADAESVLALQGNQGTVHEEVQSYLDDAITRRAKELVHLETVEREHGRLETRRSWPSAARDWLADQAQWEGLCSVGVVEAVRQVGEQPATVERRYDLSSLGLDAARFARAGHAAENLGTLHRLALNLLQREKTKRRGLKGKQKNAGWDHSYLLTLLGI